jgi:hypothetical protein
MAFLFLCRDPMAFLFLCRDPMAFLFVTQGPDGVSICTQGPDCYVLGMAEPYRLPNKIFTQLGLTHPGYQTHYNKTQLYVMSIARLGMAEVR